MPQTSKNLIRCYRPAGSRAGMVILQQDGAPWASFQMAEVEAMVRHGASLRFHYPVPVESGFGLQVGGVPPFFEHLPEDIKGRATAKLLALEEMFEEHSHRGRQWWQIGPNFAQEILAARKSIVTMAREYTSRLVRFKAGDRRVKEDTLYKYLWNLWFAVAQDIEGPHLRPISPEAQSPGKSGIRKTEVAEWKYTNQHEIDGIEVSLEWNRFTDAPDYWLAVCHGHHGLSYLSPEDAVAVARKWWARSKERKCWEARTEFSREDLEGLGGSPARNRRMIRDLARARHIDTWKTARIKTLVEDILVSQPLWLRIQNKKGT